MAENAIISHLQSQMPELLSCDCQVLKFVIDYVLRARSHSWVEAVISGWCIAQLPLHKLFSAYSAVLESCSPEVIHNPPLSPVNRNLCSHINLADLPTSIANTLPSPPLLSLPKWQHYFFSNNSIFLRRLSFSLSIWHTIFSMGRFADRILRSLI